MANSNGSTVSKTAPPGIVALSKWIKDVGISRMTAYRWRKDKILVTHNLYGKQYLTRAAAAELQQRLIAGEFRKVVNTHSARVARETKATRAKKAVIHA
ncbi:MAG: hypothetical protein ABSA83_15515 [Verrucomicrobiota bacterium]|jgi:predicted site-specific integrase-resolvase